MKNKAQYTLPIALGVIGIIFLFVVATTVYTVPAGHRGVLLTFGKPSEDVKGEGIGFKIPIAQTVKKLEVRTQKIEVLSDSASRDLQDVQTTIALNFHIDPYSTNKLYQEVGLSYPSRIIHPAIQESVKSVTATFTAEELITRRPEVRADIQEALRERLANYYLMVDDFNIVNFQFSEEFDRAIEAKVTAEQQMLKAQKDLERIKIEKEQLITQAEAEAQSIKIQSEALRENPDILQLRAIQKWNGVMPKVTGGAMPFIDITSEVNSNNS